MANPVFVGSPASRHLPGAAVPVPAHPCVNAAGADAPPLAPIVSPAPLPARRERLACRGRAPAARGPCARLPSCPRRGSAATAPGAEWHSRPGGPAPRAGLEGRKRPCRQPRDRSVGSRAARADPRRRRRPDRCDAAGGGRMPGLAAGAERRSGALGGQRPASARSGHGVARETPARACGAPPTGRAMRVLARWTGRSGEGAGSAIAQKERAAPGGRP